MPLGIPVVWSDSCLLHEPGGEVWIGVPIPGDEVPARATLIRDALVAAGAPVFAAEEHSDDAILAVHDPELVAFLCDAWETWQQRVTRTTQGRPVSCRTSFRTPDS